jgi:hypothetical protein
MKKAMAANDYLIEDRTKAQTVRNLLGEETAEKLPGQVDMFGVEVETKKVEEKTERTKV